MHMTVIEPYCNFSNLISILIWLQNCSIKWIVRYLIIITLKHFNKLFVSRPIALFFFFKIYNLGTSPESARWFFVVFRGSSKYVMEDSTVLRYSRLEEERSLSYREYMPSIWQVCDKLMLSFFCWCVLIHTVYIFPNFLYIGIIITV